MAPGSGSEFTVSVTYIVRPKLRGQLRRTFPTHFARLHRISERRRTGKSGDERDKGVHDGAVALARGGAVG